MKRIAAALFVCNRDALLAAEDVGAAYACLSTLGADLSDPRAIEAMLRVAGTLKQAAKLSPGPLADARRRHASRLEAEHGRDASQIAHAAVATATAVTTTTT